MALQAIKNIFLRNKQEETLNSSGTRTGMHDNKYELTEEDRAKAEEVKRINREIKKRKALRDAYIEKLLDDKEIALIKSEIDQIHGDKEEGGMADQIFNNAISQLMQQQGINLPNGTSAAPTNPEEDFYSDEIVNSANAGIQQPQIQEEEIQVQSRFSDDEIKKNIPKLLNKTQIEHLSKLSSDEVLQIHSLIKKGL